MTPNSAVNYDVGPFLTSIDASWEWYHLMSLVRVFPWRLTSGGGGGGEGNNMLLFKNNGLMFFLLLSVNFCGWDKAHFFKSCGTHFISNIWNLPLTLYMQLCFLANFSVVIKITSYFTDVCSTV